MKDNQKTIIKTGGTSFCTLLTILFISFINIL